MFHFQKNKNNILALIQYARARPTLLRSSRIKKNPFRRFAPSLPFIASSPTPLFRLPAIESVSPRSLSLGIEGKEDGSILLRPAPLPSFHIVAGGDTRSTLSSFRAAPLWCGLVVVVVVLVLLYWFRVALAHEPLEGTRRARGARACSNASSLCRGRAPALIRFRPQGATTLVVSASTHANGYFSFFGDYFFSFFIFIFFLTELWSAF